MEISQLGKLQVASQLELGELLQVDLQLPLQLLNGLSGRVDDAFGHLVLKVYVFRLEFFQRGGKTERPEKIQIECVIIGIRKLLGVI